MGIEAAAFGAAEEMKVCTGRWGCGAFRGDVYLKFAVQWVACSIASRDMVYVAQDEEEAKEIETMCYVFGKYKT